MKNYFINQSCNEYPYDYQFNGIDIFKFVCAILVCVIHIAPFPTDSSETSFYDFLNFGLQRCLCRIAVPYYFTAAGFLLFRKTNFRHLDGERIKNYCFKILRLLGTWTFLLFIGESAQLWFLGAVVLAVSILSALVKKGLSLKMIGIIAIVFFSIGLLGDSYRGLIEPLKSFTIPNQLIVGYETLFVTTRNGVFLGFIFVFLGALFAQKNIAINYLFAVVGLIASLGLLFLEVYILKNYFCLEKYNMYISLLPLIFFFFYLSTHISIKNRPIYRSLRVIGLLVFFMHMFVDYYVCWMFQIVKNEINIDLSYFHFIITICLTLFLAFVIERLSKKKNLFCLKYLYS